MNSVTIVSNIKQMGGFKPGAGSAQVVGGPKPMLPTLNMAGDGKGVALSNLAHLQVTVENAALVARANAISVCAVVPVVSNEGSAQVAERALLQVENTIRDARGSINDIETQLNEVLAKAEGLFEEFVKDLLPHRDRIKGYLEAYRNSLPKASGGPVADYGSLGGVKAALDKKVALKPKLEAKESIVAGKAKHTKKAL